MRYPRPTTAQLGYGLHGLVITLAVVVALRAVLLDEPGAGRIVALVVAFVGVYLVRTRTKGVLRLVLLGALLALWLGLVHQGGDASYVSVGVFLVLLTELAPGPALLGVVILTGIDIGAGITRDGGPEVVVAPVLGAVLTTLLGVGFRVLLDAVTRQDELIEQLRTTRDELAASERAAGQASERERLAREIHDTVAQGLSSIQMLLRSVEGEHLPTTAAERVALARGTAASGLEETRRLIRELGPADLEGASVAAALRRVGERATSPVTLHVDGDLPPLPMPVEAAIVRIAQSALANVEQHAGPGAQAVVTLGRIGDEVRLDVVDDGVGITGSWARPGFGLATVRDRVTELGGDLHLESEPGRTALTASFPLRPEGAR